METLSATPTAHVPPGFPPTSHEYFQMISPTLLAFTIVAVVCALLTVALSVLHIYTLINYVQGEMRRNLMILIALNLPVLGIFSAIGTCIPRALNVAEAFSIIFLMTGFIGFMLLLENLFMGRQKMSNELNEAGIRLVLRSVPVCCCCPCLPKLVPTTRNLLRVEMLVLQAPVVRFLMLAVRLIVILDDWGHFQNMHVSESITSVITVLSTLCAVWGCMILMKASVPVLIRYPVRRLFTILQLLIILANLQGVVFKILASTGVIRTDDIMGAKHWARLYHTQLLTVEVLFVSLLATVMLRPKDYSLLYEDRRESAGSDLQKE